LEQTFFCRDQNFVSEYKTRVEVDSNYKALPNSTHTSRMLHFLPTISISIRWLNRWLNQVAQSGGPIGGPMDSLSNRQYEVLKFIILDKKISKRSLAKMLEINVSAAQTHIETLREKGFIERIGGTRGY